MQQIESVLREIEFHPIRMLNITGGEPLSHEGIEQILKMFTSFRERQIHHPRFILSTSLSFPLKSSILEALPSAFDSIGVSLDGPEQIHDQRRGSSSYRTTINNLKILKKYHSHIRIYCTPDPTVHQVYTDCIRHVEEISRQMGFESPQIVQLLPIGRAGNIELPLVSKGFPNHKTSEQLIFDGFRPRKRCVGTQLHIDADGFCYPCYACHWPETLLGNIKDGLAQIINISRNLFKICSVDTNSKCKICEWRYLCGGACQAWQNNKPGSDLNNIPPVCSQIKNQARDLYQTALEFLKNKFLA
jgi:uncharacterized protein